jgi:hypothetical protein
MAYVDLNPIRANIADTPETSEYTSVRERIQPRFNLADAIKNQAEQKTLNNFTVPLKPLLGFEERIHQGSQRGVLFCLKDYLTLVDETGRITRKGKRGAIATNLLPILARLNLDPDRWCERAIAFEATYGDYRKERVHINNLA